MVVLVLAEAIPSDPRRRAFLFDGLRRDAADFKNPRLRRDHQMRRHAPPRRTAIESPPYLVSRRRDIYRHPPANGMRLDRESPRQLGPRRGQNQLMQD